MTRASEMLQEGGYSRRRGEWELRLASREFLDAQDVPARLLELLEKELEVIVPSGIFDADVRLTVERGRHGPPRMKATPIYDDE